MPNYHAGYYKDIQTINLSLVYASDEKPSSDFIRLNVENKAFDNVIVEEGKMPNMKNFGLKDAVYVSELLGLNPIVAGRGKVVDQSPLPGTIIKESQTVYLRLN